MYRKILFPVDLSNQDVQVKALSVAIQWCQAFAAELHVLTVIPDYGLSYVAQYFPNGDIEKMSAEVSEKLAGFIAEQVPEEVAATALVRHGTPYNEILTTAEEIGADLIIMGSHRPEFSDYLLGPNASRVVRHAAISVLVVR